MLTGSKGGGEGGQPQAAPSHPPPADTAPIRGATAAACGVPTAALPATGRHGTPSDRHHGHRRRRRRPDAASRRRHSATTAATVATHVRRSAPPLPDPGEKRPPADAVPFCRSGGGGVSGYVPGKKGHIPTDGWRGTRAPCPGVSKTNGRVRHPAVAPCRCRYLHRRSHRRPWWGVWRPPPLDTYLPPLHSRRTTAPPPPPPPHRTRHLPPPPRRHRRPLLSRGQPLPGGSGGRPTAARAPDAFAKRRRHPPCRTRQKGETAPPAILAGERPPVPRALPVARRAQRGGVAAPPQVGRPFFPTSSRAPARDQWWEPLPPVPSPRHPPSTYAALGLGGCGGAQGSAEGVGRRHKKGQKLVKVGEGCQGGTGKGGCRGEGVAGAGCGWQGGAGGGTVPPGDGGKREVAMGGGGFRGGRVSW